MSSWLPFRVTLDRASRRDLLWDGVELPERLGMAVGAGEGVRMDWRLKMWTGTAPKVFFLPAFGSLRSLGGGTGLGIGCGL